MNNLFLFKTLARAKQSATTILVAIIIFFLYPVLACATENGPREEDKLPWSVFPLDGVKWMHIQYLKFLEPDNEFIYDTETGENRANLYCSKATKWDRLIFDNINKINLYDDTVWYSTSELYGEINLEHKRIYFRGFYYNGKPWAERELLYDFNLNVGDTFTMMGIDNYKFSILSVDSVLVDNEYRKVYNFETKSYGGHSFSVIEGIGCNINLFHTIIDPFVSVDPSPPRLLSVYFKSRKIWGN